MQKALAKFKSPFFLLFIAALALSFSRFSLIALVAMVIGWVLVSSNLFGRRFYGSYLTHLFLGFLFFVSVNSLIGIFGRILGTPILMPYVVFANGLLVWLLVDFLRHRKAASIDTSVKPQWIIIAMSLLIIATFSLPIILRPTSANLLRYSAFGYDDAAHIQMYRGNIDDRGFIAKVNLKQQPDLNIDPADSSYPQSLHFNLSLFARGVFALFNSSLANVKQLLLVYHVGLMLVYGAIVTIVAELLAQLVARLRKTNVRSLGIISQLGIAASVFVVYATLVYPEISYAGETFLATIAMLGGTLLTLAMYAKDAALPKRAVFLAACLLSIGVAYTWVLSLLPAFAALALVALTIKTNKQLKWYAARLSRPSSFPMRQFLVDNWAWVAIVITGILILPQLYVLVTNSTTGAASLNIDGGIASPDHTRYLVLALALVTGIILSALRKDDKGQVGKSLLDFGLLLFTPMLLVLFFYAVQTITTGQLTYYFTKTTYLAYIALLILVGVVATHLLHLLEKVLGWIRTAYIGLILFGILSIYLSVGRGFLLYAHGTNTYVRTNLTNVAGNLIDQGVRPRDIISYTGRAYEEDMLFNLITDQLDEHRSPDRHVIAILAQQKRYKVFEQFVANYTLRKEKTYILVTKQTQQSMQQALPADGNYQLIVVNE